MAETGSSENTQCNGKISKEEQKEFIHKKTKDPKDKEFVNRSQHAKEYSQKRKGKGHEASGAAGGGRDDDDDEGGKKDKLSDLGKTDAVYCSICDIWFSDNEAYLKHVAKKLCEQLYLG